jgi:hypothetical protein
MRCGFRRRSILLFARSLPNSTRIRCGSSIVFCTIICRRLTGYHGCTSDRTGHIGAIAVDCIPLDDASKRSQFVFAVARRPCRRKPGDVRGCSLARPISLKETLVSGQWVGAFGGALKRHAETQHWRTTTRPRLLTARTPFVRRRYIIGLATRTKIRILA